MFARTAFLAAEAQQRHGVYSDYRERHHSLAAQTARLPGRDCVRRPRRHGSGGLSLWGHKEHAEAYHRGTYPAVLQALANVVEGTPQVHTYEVSNSTFHKIVPRVAV